MQVKHISQSLSLKNEIFVASLSIWYQSPNLLMALVISHMSITKYKYSHPIFNFYILTSKTKNSSQIKSKLTSVPTLNKNDGSASIRFLSIEQCLIKNPSGQAEPCMSNTISKWICYIYWKCKMNFTLSM